jgi:L-iditol 2-dehydrogenase
MKSYKLIGIERFGLFDTATPTFGPGDVLIRVERVGICGSDVHYYSEGKIGSQIVKFPWTVGHEGAGTVEAVGDSVQTVKPGDRVAFDPASPCGKCQQCLTGRPHTCSQLTFLGCPGQVEGCLSEYLVLAEASCLNVPDSLSLDEAAMVEPLSIAVYGASLSGGIAGAKIGVLGCGPIGLCLIQVLKSSGADRIYATDKIERRLAIARHLGADWAGNISETDIVADIAELVPNGLDLVFECCGQQNALDQAIRLLKPGGELSIIGIPETNSVSFDINLLRRKEIRIQNVRRQNHCLEKALTMIESGLVDAKSMITHRYDFRQTPDAFDLVKNYRDGVVKAMISFE